MKVQQFVRTSEALADAVTLQSAQDPARRRELMAKLGLTDMAGRSDRALAAETHYTPLGDMREAYFAYFTRRPALESFTGEIPDEVLGMMSHAVDATYNSRELFDRLDIRTTRDGREAIVLGTIAEGKTTEQFLIAQWGDKLPNFKELADLLAADKRKQDKQARAEGRWNWLEPVLDLAMEFSGALAGVLAIATLSVLVLWQNWNWWLFGVAICAIIGFILSVEMEDVLGYWLNGICALMMAGYGIANIPMDPNISHPTVLVCGFSTDYARGDNGEVLTVLNSPQGDYDIIAGKYYVTVGDLKDHKVKTVFEPTSTKAATTFQIGHTYKLTVNSFAGTSNYSGITSAKEVPNTLGTCG